MPDLSIIIVNYNTRRLLKTCLQSVYRSYKGYSHYKNYNLEVIVIDNNSKDGSSEMLKKEFPKIKLLQNKENLGFAKANNQGIKIAKGKYLLLLNSDTEVRSNTLFRMIKFMNKNPQVGVATCRVELPDGSLDLACHRGFPTPWRAFCYFSGLEKLLGKYISFFGDYHLLNKQISKDSNKQMNIQISNITNKKEKVHEIDSPSGAFYLIRRQVIDQVGLLDERFFMYAEDLDWSYRIKKAGWKIIYVPDVKIIHYKKQSGRAINDKKLKNKTEEHFWETMKLFYKKHYENKYPRWLMRLIFWAIDKLKKSKIKTKNL